MKVLYIAHPLEGDISGNLGRAKRWIRWAFTNFEVSPVADWVLLATIFDDRGMWSRDRFLKADVSLVEKCDGILLTGGRISPGMEIERLAALRAGISVIDLTRFGPEPPNPNLVEELALLLRTP